MLSEITLGESEYSQPSLLALAHRHKFEKFDVFIPKLESNCKFKFEQSTFKLQSASTGKTVVFKCDSAVIEVPETAQGNCEIDQKALHYVTHNDGSESIEFKTCHVLSLEGFEVLRLEQHPVSKIQDQKQVEIGDTYPLQMSLEEVRAIFDDKYSIIADSTPKNIETWDESYSNHIDEDTLTLKVVKSLERVLPRKAINNSLVFSYSVTDNEFIQNIEDWVNEKLKPSDINENSKTNQEELNSEKLKINLYSIEISKQLENDNWREALFVQLDKS